MTPENDEIPPEARNFKVKLPDGETYDVSGPSKTLKKIDEDDSLAERFDEAALERAEDIFESGHLLSRIKKGETVLYIGTGSGHVADHIEKETGAKIIKFDLADLRTPADIKDDKFALANARRLPVKDNSLDTICLFDLLHHTLNQNDILKEALRVLKPGGKLLIMEDTIPEKFQKGVKFKKWIVGKMDDILNKQPTGANPHNYQSISDWEILLHKVGFNIDSNKTFSWHWGIPDLVGADRTKRPDHNTLLRPFEATMFEAIKPIEAEMKEK